MEKLNLSFEKETISSFLTGFITAIITVFLFIRILPIYILTALFQNITHRKSPLIPYDSDSEGDDEEGEEPSATDSQLSQFPNQTVSANTRCKLVLIIRTDLKMTAGKIAAQCCHATLAAYRVSLKRKGSNILDVWRKNGEAKITLKCNSEAEMLDLEEKAKKKGLVARSILDAGHTQIDPGSRTVLAIGPADQNVINEITGHLKLY
ncbi:hypothetical protein HK098_001125 [Nowakowskiella sp. JEL0407]|nr:hypothetical protein HK098_001125 [Nowakowskiella sp. JEL0407]